MQKTLTACDLCPAALPQDKAGEAGFSTLTIQGEARHVVRTATGILGQIDLCPGCVKELGAFLAAHKARANTVAVPTPPKSREEKLADAKAALKDATADLATAIKNNKDGVGATTPAEPIA